MADYIDWLSDETKFVADEAALEMVMSMGFTREQATKALKVTNNNLERAADWIFSHQAELDAQEMDTSATPAEETFRDGNGREWQNQIFQFNFSIYE